MGQSGQAGQSGFLEGDFILDGHLGQVSGESQGQKLRHTFQRIDKVAQETQPCDKVMRVGLAGLSDSFNPGATLASGHGHTFPIFPPDLFVLDAPLGCYLFSVFPLTPH